MTGGAPVSHLYLCPSIIGCDGVFIMVMSAFFSLATDWPVKDV